MIIDRYLIREIVKPLLLMLTILVIIFAAYTTSRNLADALNGLMSLDTITALILLKITIALEVLVPASLYLSVIVGLGRLYKDSEMTALFASGLAPSRILAVAFVLALSASLLVASLSLFLRPWAYEKSFWLKAKAEAEFDVTRLKAGRFYEIGEGTRVIFIEKIGRDRKRAEGIFMQKNQKGNNDIVEVVYAQQAYQQFDQASGRQVIHFVDGSLYEFSRTGTWKGKAMQSGQYTLSLWPNEITPREYKIKAASVSHLARSQALPDIAELQWRISAPISTILLALLAVPLSRTTPRQGKHAKVLTAMVIYALYYSICTMGKIWVEQGFVSPTVGIWWVQGLLAAVVLTVLLHPSQQFRAS